VKGYHASTKLLGVQDYFTISHLIVDKYNHYGCFMHGRRIVHGAGKGKESQMQEHCGENAYHARQPLARRPQFDVLKG